MLLQPENIDDIGNEDEKKQGRLRLPDDVPCEGYYIEDMAAEEGPEAGREKAVFQKKDVTEIACNHAEKKGDGKGSEKSCTCPANSRRISRESRPRSAGRIPGSAGQGSCCILSEPGEIDSHDQGHQEDLGDVGNPFVHGPAAVDVDDRRHRQGDSQYCDKHISTSKPSRRPGKSGASARFTKHKARNHAYPQAVTIRAPYIQTHES